MLFKEGNDSFIQVIQTSHPIRHSLPVVCSNHAAPKESLECMEQLDIALVLYNCEFRKDLKPRSHLRMRIDSDEETTFAIHKPNHPLCFQISRMWLNVKSLRVLHTLEPSLRIVPVSDQILTAAVMTTSTDRLCEEFPAYSSVLLRLANSLTLGPL